MDLTVSHIFHFDIDALHAYFIDARILRSLGLESLASILSSLPSLRKADTGVLHGIENLINNIDKE